MSARRVSAAAAVAGALAVGLALATGEVVAALAGVVAPVTAVSQQVVPLAPAGLTAWAIETLGQANTVVLEVGTAVLAIAIGAGTGVLARRTFRAAVVVFVTFGVVGLAAALAQPEAGWTAALVIAVVVASGLVTLRLLLSALPPASSAPRPPSDGDAPTPTVARDAPTPTAVQDAPTPTVARVGRRSFLATAAGVGALAVVGAAGGRLFLSRYAGGTDPTTIALPPPARALGQVPPGASLDVPGITPILTPTERFFRIDTALAVPRVDLDTWSLTIRGLVDRELELSYDDLLDAPLVEVDSTLACVSNEVGGSLIGTARWLGVRLDELLEHVGVDARAGQVVGRSVDGFTAGFPLEAALDGRDALVAVGMNGEALPARHGFPARLVVPGLYGYVSATKWLASIELTTWDGFDGYWVPRGWAKRAPLKTGSRIDVPREDAAPQPGEVVVAGVAWAAREGISRVEVEVDGLWREAQLSRPLSQDTWVQWRLATRLEQGPHRLRVRATDGHGDLQPEGPVPPRPDGAEGWHVRDVHVG